MHPTLRHTPPIHCFSMMAVFQPQLRGADGGHIAARSAPDDSDIERF